MSKQALIGVAAAVSAVVLSLDMSRSDPSFLDMFSLSSAYAQEAEAVRAPQQGAVLEQRLDNDSDPDDAVLPPSPSVLQYYPETLESDESDITATFAYINAVTMNDHFMTVSVPPKPAQGDRVFQLLPNVIYMFHSSHSFQPAGQGRRDTLLEIPFVLHPGDNPVAATLVREEPAQGRKRKRIVKEPVSLALAEEGVGYVRLGDELYALKEMSEDGTLMLLPVDPSVPYHPQEVRNRGGLVATMGVVMPDGSTSTVPLEPTQDSGMTILPGIDYALTAKDADPALSVRFYVTMHSHQRPEYGIGQDTKDVTAQALDDVPSYVIHRVFFEQAPGGKQQRLDGADLQTLVTVYTEGLESFPTLSIEGHQYRIAAVRDGKALLKEYQPPLLPPIAPPESDTPDTFLDLGFVQLTSTETMVAAGVLSAIVAGLSAGIYAASTDNITSQTSIPTVPLTGLNND